MINESSSKENVNKLDYKSTNPTDQSRTPLITVTESFQSRPSAASITVVKTRTGYLLINWTEYALHLFRLQTNTILTERNSTASKRAERDNAVTFMAGHPEDD